MQCRSLIGSAKLLAIAVLAATILFAAPGVAGDEGDTDLPVGLKTLSTSTYPKMESMLSDLVERYTGGQITAYSAASLAPAHHSDTVGVTLRASEDISAVVGFLETNDALIRGSGQRYVRAYVPVSLLTKLHARPDVIKIEAIIPARIEQEPPVDRDHDRSEVRSEQQGADPSSHGVVIGSVSSEGTIVHNSREWNLRGFRGEGVKVGVIDVDFDGFPGLMGTELPTDVKALCFIPGVEEPSNDPRDCETDQSAHGTVVAEAVLDVAPDVSLYISNVWGGGDFNEIVDWMIAEGVDVINTSLTSSWSGPGDGTSPYEDSPLNAVDRAIGAGIVWLSSAGNDADRMWLSDFSDQDGDKYLEFDGSDETNDILLRAGEEIGVAVRWEDDWNGAKTDLDIYLLNPEGDRIWGSEDTQAGAEGQNPVERFEFEVPDQDPIEQTYQLEVYHYNADDPDAGEDPKWLQFQVFTPEPGFEHRDRGGSIGEPAESANSGLVAVGAAPWFVTNYIESFSSIGPTPDGRTKPDVVGADRAVSYLWGSWGGTSQSSPHLAGMAALVLERFPDLGPSDIADYLKTNTEERGEPGIDNTWGHGFAVLPGLGPIPEQNDGEVLTASPPGKQGGRFGFSVDMTDDFAVVGAPYNDVDGSEDTGAVYLFAEDDYGATSTSSVGPFWRLDAWDGAAGDLFGVSVAIDEDSQTIVVGASHHDADGKPDSGAVYVFATSTIAKLTAPGGEEGDLFGVSAAIDGDTIVVGAMRATGPNGPRAGAAYVFTMPEGGWMSTSAAVKLTAADGGQDHEFGRSVAVDGRTIAVGARRADGNEPGAGAVYLYSRPDAGWTATSTVEKLVAQDGESFDMFGSAVALEGETVVIGAPGATTGDRPTTGAVYVAERQGTGATSTTMITRLSTPVRVESFAQFGASVDIDGGTIAAGAPGDSGNQEGEGVVYLLHKVGGVWDYVYFYNDPATRPLDLRPTLDYSAEGNEGFGSAVSVRRDRVFAGATGSDRDGGSAYLLSPPDVGWGQFDGQGQFYRVTELVNVELQGGEAFGWAVAADSDTVAVGVPFADVDRVSDAGVVYVFDESGNAVLRAPADDPHGQFGRAVDVDGDMIVVGAHGAAYLFMKPVDGWGASPTPLRLLPHASDTPTDFGFGHAVAIDGDTIVVGAPGVSRTVYVFTRPPEGWGAAPVPELLTTSQESSDAFGYSVALSGSTIVVGDPRSSLAHVFVRSEEGWSSVDSDAVLDSHDPGAYTMFGQSVAVDGSTVVVGAPDADYHPDPTVAGFDYGVVFVFNEPLGGWAATTSVPIMLLDLDAEGYDRFGTSVSIEGNAVAVGIPKTGALEGSVLIFNRTAIGTHVSGNAVMRLRGSDTGSNGQLGSSLAIGGGSVVAGAYRDHVSRGRAAIFRDQFNRAAAFDAGATITLNIDEDATVGATVAASDPDGDSLTASIAGSQAELEAFNAAFEWELTGDGIRITLAPGVELDYETRSKYEVSFGIGDGLDEFGDPDPDGVIVADDTIEVTIEVDNVDEFGRVELQPTGTPRVGTTITASLSDPDGFLADTVQWQWHRVNAGATDPVSIGGAVAAQYTPTGPDVGHRLLVEASYTDGHGPDKIVSVSTDAVQAIQSQTPAGGGSSRQSSRQSQPTSTPVPTVIVPEEEIVAVETTKNTETVVVVQPDAATQIASVEDDVVVSFPVVSRAETFQVKVDTDTEVCGELQDNIVLNCVDVAVFDSKGKREENTRLISGATLAISVRPDRVETLGGGAVLLQTHALGGFELLQRGGLGDPWRKVLFTLTLDTDGGAKVTVDTIRHFSEFMLVLNEAVLTQAQGLVSAAAATPTPAPQPVVTAVPTATALPTPAPASAMPSPTQAAAMSTPDVPDTGGPSAPGAVLAAIAAAGGLMVAAGVAALRSRRSTVILRDRFLHR